MMRRTLFSALVGVGMTALLTTAPSCSSTNESGGGAPGSGGTIGGLGGAAGIAAAGGTSGAGGMAVDAARDALLDAAPTGTPFPCGDTMCAIGETYCRQVSGGHDLDGGLLPTYYSCVAPVPGCTPLDCSCVSQFQGFADCPACQQMPNGAVVAFCEPV